MNTERSGSLSWTTAARIAAREMAHSRGKFLFLICALAVGVGSLAGVRGFGRAFRVMLLSEARTLMAGDLMVRNFGEPNAVQDAGLKKLTAKGVRMTRVSETISMLSMDVDHPPLLVSLKAVDPTQYPYYGTLELRPNTPITEILKPDTIAVSEDIRIRTDLKIGDTVRLGESAFRIAGEVISEPDRMTGSLNVGPRILMSREAFDRTGLIQPGSRAPQRILFKLDPSRLSVSTARNELNSLFERALVTDYRETHPLITRGLDRAENFLSLVSLIALVVGALGVAATMHSHLQQKLDSIAIMKCIGGRSSHIIRIHVLQTIVVGVIGGAAGCLVGLGVQAVFPVLIQNLFSIRPQVQWDFRAAAEAITVGLLTALLFTWPALLGIRTIRPAVIFRRDHDDATGTWRKRWLAPAPWISGLSILAGLAAIAGYLTGATFTDAARVGGYFAGGLFGALLLLGAVSWLLLRGLRLILRSPRSAMPASVRHGIANIYRPGNQAQSVLVSLGVGVMFTLTVFLVQRGLLQQMLASAPPDMPNVFLINITSRERDGMQALLASAKSVQGKPEVTATIAADLERVDGVAFKDQRRTRGVSSRTKLSSQAQIVQGKWINGPDQLCIDQPEAERIRAKVGSTVDFKIMTEPVSAKVVCIFRTEEVRMAGGSNYLFSPGTLDRFPLQYFAAVRMKPSEVASFQRATFRQYPSVTVINGADVLETIQQVVDQIALVVRFISLFSILAGVIILASSVAATRFRRVKEVAILKTLGATRSRVMAIFSVEFLVLGVTAGILGAGLANVFSNSLLVGVLDARFSFDWIPNITAILLTAVITLVAGWLAAFRILGRKPLEVLRGE